MMNFFNLYSAVLATISIVAAFVPDAKPFVPRHSISTRPKRTTAIFISPTPYANPQEQGEEMEEKLLERSGISRNGHLRNIIGSAAQKLLRREKVGHTVVESSTMDTTSLPLPSIKTKIKETHPAIPNLQLVKTLDEYKTVVGQEKEKIVVVRFFATWCKACKAVAPYYRRLALQNPDVLFVNVPVSESNTDLHRGLKVPSLPYGHVYYPDLGMTEEMKISRKHFGRFARIVRSYVEGQCDVEDEVLSGAVSVKKEMQP